MTIAKHIEVIMSKASWIRKMFEEGARLKAIHGAENVFDFSLGNPNLDPPEAFNTILKTLLDQEAPGCHGYMPNTGYLEVRKSVADYLCLEQGVSISAAEIIMTCGAAGGLNVILKAIVDPGDEILTPTPHFVEYGFYVGNHGGILKTVPTNPDFTLNIEAISDAITPKTKAVLINSPNNPTGQIYSKESLVALGQVMTQKGKTFGRTIYLMSDEPYRKVIYDGAQVPSVFDCYAESIMTTSYSKDISIPGERIGFIAVNPAATYKDALLSAMALTNRILGFVNAPALMQRVIARMQGLSVDISAYARKRELLCGGLSESGYDFVKPPGTFYLFPRTPIADDVEFVKALQKELILVVPGSGFGGPGHFRIAFCVSDDTIIKALPGFKRVMNLFRTG
ncbi:MAG: pyridoxal phosphate-dependent aminotransferase [Desulfatirhabdiaceae bacterium]|nr:pyridoxal phosphate-dependent aminotransferase [Desulfatirhabdiaceae bacterium]